MLQTSSEESQGMLLSISKSVGHPPAPPPQNTPQAKNYLTQNVNSTEVEKLWSRPQHGSVFMPRLIMRSRLSRVVSKASKCLINWERKKLGVSGTVASIRR